MAVAYLTGFDNEHETEAVPGALPRGRFNPQRVPHGLYAEQYSATAFTAPRHANRRSWLYRIRPSVAQGAYVPLDAGLVRTAPLTEAPFPPDAMRWDPLPPPDPDTDFVTGLVTMAANGDAALQLGIGVHVYRANRAMTGYFQNADGELLIVPQAGALRARTEFGVLEVPPGHVLVIPRGVRFAIDPLCGGSIYGYVCENYGAPLTLPERGPVGANGFANDRDFEYPVAAFEDVEGACELVVKFAGGLYTVALDHSPLDVVAWTGNAAPYRYDLARFCVINSVSYDHPDPSIFTVLTSPSETAGTANVDFVIFPPRWMVAEDTFRPPWFHRNVMSEFMGLIEGVYDAKEAGFLPGGASLHNCMTPHGPEAAVAEKAMAATLAPERYRDTLAFMFESRYPIRPTSFALETPARQATYARCWDGLARRFPTTR